MTQLRVAQALEEGRALGLDRLDAHVLLAHVLGRSRTWVLAHGEAGLNVAELDRWRGYAQRRADGVPVAYLVGQKEFHGLTLDVDPRVLIPRSETEVLVDRAIELLEGRSLTAAAPRVVDLGTGSGAIALALKAAYPAAQVCASDDSATALDVAQANADRLGIDIGFRAGSWWQPWTGERFDLALSNPPYIAEGDPHLTALGHEPITALAAGLDGLAALRVIVLDAADHLSVGGWLMLEHGFDQARAVRELLHAAGFAEVHTLRDLGRHERCTAGRV